MYYYNSTLKATHPDASKWYQWPFDGRPIWYWSKANANMTANIYLFGNPLVWWFVLLGVIFSVIGIWVKKIRQKLPPIFYILLLGYFANILPYIFITRIAFLYHYLPSFIFGILILSVIYEKILSPFLIGAISKKGELYCYYGFLLLCFLCFLILSPLSFGFFISSNSPLHWFYNNFIKFLS
jgi:dolichyl-phosphate-mannose--protein O-mannosyl transferase